VPTHMVVESCLPLAPPSERAGCRPAAVLVHPVLRIAVSLQAAEGAPLQMCCLSYCRCAGSSSGQRTVSVAPSARLSSLLLLEGLHCWPRKSGACKHLERVARVALKQQRAGSDATICSAGRRPWSAGGGARGGCVRHAAGGPPRRPHHVSLCAAAEVGVPQRARAPARYV